MPAPKKENFVTQEQFNALEGSVTSLVDLIKENMAAKATPVETKVEKEIASAGANVAQTNPEWDSQAREIIGNAVDHTEVDYTKSGGILFTVVIKTELSNAGREYLDRVKVDRRTKEVGQQGLEGVIEWCRLIKQNLARGVDARRA